MASVSLRGVSKTYRTRQGAVRAVDGVDLDILDGELLVLVGPSGCGKTTMLRLIAGLETPDRGAIRIGDRPVEGVAPKDRDVAVVFQHYALYPHMTVFKNMAFGLKMRGHRKDDIARRVHRAAERLDISELLDRQPAALSAGQRQRVALGRAIVRQPRVFLFDEPLANLDIRLRLTTRAHLRTLHEQLGTTTVHVTHDQEEAMTLGDRIAVMNHGMILQVGHPLDVYRLPVNLFVGGFVGSPSMNLIEGVLREAKGGSVAAETPLGLVSFPPHLPSREVPPIGTRIIVGIRPEHVVLGDSQIATTDHTAYTPPVKMRITMLEPLGDRTHVHLTQNEKTQLLATAAAGARLKPSQTVTVRLMQDQCHFFDPRNDGRRL